MDQVPSLVFDGRKHVELKPWPYDTSPPGAGEITGRTLVTLVSPGTELNDYFHSTHPEKGPRVAGYAAIAEIEQVGDGVADRKPGDRVFVMGGHRAFQRAKAADTVLIPDGLASETAVFCRLIGVSWPTLITTRARPADRVVIVGLGIVGNLAAQLVQAAGYRVTAIDLDEHRRAECARLGVKDVRAEIPLDDTEVRTQAAMVIDCAGHEAVIADACRMVKKGGEVVMIGLPWRKHTDEPPLQMLHDIFRNYVTLRSGWEFIVPRHEIDFRIGSTWGIYEDAVEWLARGRIRVDGLAKRVRPADAQQVYTGLLDQSWPALTAVFDWSDR